MLDRDASPRIGVVASGLPARAVVAGTAAVGAGAVAVRGASGGDLATRAREADE